MDKKFYERLLSELEDIDNSIEFNDPDFFSEIQSELSYIQQRINEKLAEIEFLWK